MATFQIHEDNENKINMKNGIKNVDLVSDVSRKRPISSRSAFQTVNVVKQEAKRVKFYNEQSNETVRVISIQAKQPEKPDKESKNVEEDTLNLDCVKLSEKKDILAVTDQNKEDNEKGYFSLNLLYNTEYRLDILSYLKQSEMDYEWPKPNYMKKQKHLDSDMRCILVDWLVAVSDEYKMNEETLHLAVNYIDRFLSKMSVVRDKFQLLGSAAMMVAGKVEEIFPPDVKEWAYLCNNTYTSQQIMKMEQLILKVLKFDLQPSTMSFFIKFFCAEHELDEKTKYLAMYLSELVLLEGEDYLQYVPSKLAAASIALARYTLSKRHPWPKKLESSSGYSLKQLSPVVQKQNESFKDSPAKTQQTIQTKYSNSKYHKVALLQPKSLSAAFLEEE